MVPKYMSPDPNKAINFLRNANGIENMQFVGNLPASTTPWHITMCEGQIIFVNTKHPGMIISPAGELVLMQMTGQKEKTDDIDIPDKKS